MIYLSAESLIDVRTRGKYGIAKIYYKDLRKESNLIYDGISVIRDNRLYPDYTYLGISSPSQYVVQSFNGYPIYRFMNTCPECRKLTRIYVEESTIQNFFANTGYWFLQITYGNLLRTNDCKITISNFEFSANRKDKYMFNQIACCKEHLVDFPMFTIRFVNKPDEYNLKRPDYNCITITANHLYPNRINSNERKYIGYPLIDYETRVYTYYNMMNLSSINKYMRSYIFNNKALTDGFVMALSNDIGLNYEQVNHANKYDYFSFGKCAGIGHYTIDLFFANFMQTLLSYNNIECLQAMMYIPNIDVCTYWKNSGNVG